MQIPMDILIENLVSLLLLMAAGFAVAKLKLVPPEATGYLTTILMQVALPCMLISNMVRPFQREYLRDMAVVFCTACFLLLFFMLLSIPIARLLRIRKEHTGVWELSVSFSNNGLMGFPIVLAVLGEEGLALAVIFNIVQNLIIYTLGAAKAGRGLTANGVPVAFQWKKALLTMINLGIVIGLILYIAEITPPDVIMKPLTYFGNMTTPLSMLIIGMNMGNSALKETLRDRDAVIGAIVKLLLIPFAAYLLLKLVTFSNPLIPRMVLLTVAMPTASVAVILAQERGADTTLASRITLFTTCACFITVPLLCLLP